MDDNSKVTSWMWNLSQKLDAMLITVDDIMSEELQTVSANVRQFYLDFMEDVHLSSSEDQMEKRIPDLNLVSDLMEDVLSSSLVDQMEKDVTDLNLVPDLMEDVLSSSLMDQMEKDVTDLNLVPDLMEDVLSSSLVDKMKKGIPDLNLLPADVMEDVLTSSLVNQMKQRIPDLNLLPDLMEDVLPSSLVDQIDEGVPELNLLGYLEEDVSSSSVGQIEERVPEFNLVQNIDLLASEEHDACKEEGQSEKESLYFAPVELVEFTDPSPYQNSDGRMNRRSQAYVEENSVNNNNSQLKMPDIDDLGDENSSGALSFVPTDDVTGCWFCRRNIDVIHVSGNYLDVSAHSSSSIQPPNSGNLGKSLEDVPPPLLIEFVSKADDDHLDLHSELAKSSAASLSDTGSDDSKSKRASAIQWQDELKLDESCFVVESSELSFDSDSEVSFKSCKESFPSICFVRLRSEKQTCEQQATTGESFEAEFNQERENGFIKPPTPTCETGLADTEFTDSDWEIV